MAGIAIHAHAPSVPDDAELRGQHGLVGPAAQRADEPFVCLRAGSGLHTILVEAAAAEGFTPRVELETHSPASIRELVAAGLGVGLLAASTVRAIGPAVQVRYLQPAPYHPPIGLIWSRDREPGPATRAWQRYLEQACGVGEPPAAAPATRKERQT
ncbi:MAG TPA: LysR family transcriptional regulator substrate-binding protein [Streptosporangiaceae bacterium]|nr:LysR family transcriptional regulator substrate-binding protein [Streptosporangiaceae bacterium]